MPDDAHANARALLAAVARDGRHAYASLADVPGPAAAAMAEAISEDGPAAPASSGLAETELLLVRAQLRHCAHAPAKQRTRVDEIAEVAFGEIVEQFGSGQRGDELAGSRAELLAWTILHAVPEEHWSQLSVEVLDTLVAACVLGAEDGGRLGSRWRDAVARVVEASQLRAATSGERHPPFTASVLGSYGQRVGEEAAADGDPAGLVAAARALDAAIELTAPGEASDRELHELRHEAAIRALDVFRYGGSAEALARAVAHAEAALALAADDGGLRYRSQNTLARALTELATVTEQADVQDRALALWRRLAIDAEQQATPRGQAAQLLNLASELGVVGAKRGDLSLVNESLDVLEELTDGDAGGTLELVASRSNRLRTRYELTGARADIDASIELAERAVELAADARPEVVGRLLNNLAVKLRARHRDFGGQDDIERSVVLSERVLEVVPLSWHERPRWEANLGHAYRQVAEMTGRRADLTRAEDLALEAMRSTEPGTHQHAERINSYLVAASAGEDVPLARLDELVALGESLLARAAPPEARGRWLANVAALLAARYERGGAVADAERALVLWETAVAGTQPGSPDALGMLTSIGSCLTMLGDATGGSRFLARAVRVQEEVLGVLRARHGAGPATAIALVNHANALSTHGDATLDLGALERAVVAAREALAITSAGPRALAALTALGNALLTAFEIAARMYGRVDRRIPSDALGAYRAAVDLLEPGDPRYPQQAGNLANGLFQVGLWTRDLDLLTEATRWYEIATAADGTAGQPQRLTNLGMAALSAARHDRDARQREARLDVAEHAFADARSAAAEHELGVHVRIAIGRARLAGAREDDPALVTAAEEALELSRAGVRAAHADYGEAHLRPAEQLPSLGALAYLRTRGAPAAVDYLERARTLLLRSDLGRELPAGAEATLADALTAEAVQALAADLGEPVVYLLAGARGGALIACTQHAVSLTPLPALDDTRARQAASDLRLLSPGQPTGRIDRFMEAVVRVVGDLGAWAGAELQALLAEHGALTLVPVGDLAHLPWSGALVADGPAARPLVRDGALRIAGSATLLQQTALRARGRPAGGARRGVAIADPQRDDVPELTSSSGEAASVVALWRAAGMTADTLLHDRATVRAALAAAAASDVLHCACHAAERLRSRDNALLLSDGELRAAALAAAEPNLRLVFLSACSTGRIELGLADEQISLASTLIAGGVQSVVSTLWPVDDELSAMLAERFYGAWLGGVDAARALALAQWEVANAEGGALAHPWLWAGLLAAGV